MGFMKTENIKELNKMPRFTTTDLEAWVIKANISQDDARCVDVSIANEIIDRLRRLDVLKHDLDVAFFSLDTGV